MSRIFAPTEAARLAQIMRGPILPMRPVRLSWAAWLRTLAAYLFGRM
jgi:hypothetical protein